MAEMRGHSVRQIGWETSLKDCSKLRSFNVFVCCFEYVTECEVWGKGWPVYVFSGELHMIARLGLSPQTRYILQ